MFFRKSLVTIVFKNFKAIIFLLFFSGVGQPGVPVGLITRRSVVQIHPPLFKFSFFALFNHVMFR